MCEFLYKTFFKATFTISRHTKLVVFKGFLGVFINLFLSSNHLRVFWKSYTNNLKYFLTTLKIKFQMQKIFKGTITEKK